MLTSLCFKTTIKETSIGPTWEYAEYLIHIVVIEN